MSLLDNSTIALIVQPLYPPRPVQFSLLLIMAVLSLPCFIFVLYHFFTMRTLYKALNNHVIIRLLINTGLQTLTDVPMSLSYHISGIIWPPSTTYCYAFYFVDFYFFLVSLLLLSWASIERQIFIFHSHFYNTSIRRWFAHYIPLGFCCIYQLIYYVAFMFFYPCENYYDLSIANCAVACFLQDSKIMAIYEQIVQGFALISFILIFNLLLLVRIVRQKRRMGRKMTWVKNRKLAVQLLSISCLALITNSGYYTIQFVQLLWDSDFGRRAAG